MDKRRQQRLAASVSASAVIAVAAIACVVSMQSTPLAASFLDVPSSDPAFAAITFAQEQGFVNGYEDGTFRPDSTINRAEFVTLLVGTNATEEARNECMNNPLNFTFFSDVGTWSDVWYGGFLCIAKRDQLINGYPDGTFRPSNPISVTEASKIIVTHFGIPPYTEGLQPGAQWYVPFVNALAVRRVFPATIRSVEHQLTRRELAQIIHALLTSDEATQFRGAAPPEEQQEGAPQEETQPTLEIASDDTAKQEELLRMQEQFAQDRAQGTIPRPELLRPNQGLQQQSNQSAAGEVLPSQPFGNPFETLPQIPQQQNDQNASQASNGAASQSGGQQSSASAAPAPNPGTICPMIACVAPLAGCRYGPPFTLNANGCPGCGTVICSSLSSKSSSSSRSSSRSSVPSSSAPSQICGNFIVEGTEQCDTGGYSQESQTCTKTCRLKTAIPVCGNGDWEVGEECDAGTRNGDVNANCDTSCNSKKTAKEISDEFWAPAQCNEYSPQLMFVSPSGRYIAVSASAKYDNGLLLIPAAYYMRDRQTGEVHQFGGVGTISADEKTIVFNSTVTGFSSIFGQTTQISRMSIYDVQQKSVVHSIDEKTGVAGNGVVLFTQGFVNSTNSASVFRLYTIATGMTREILVPGISIAWRSGRGHQVLLSADGKTIAFIGHVGMQPDVYKDPMKLYLYDLTSNTLIDTGVQDNGSEGINSYGEFVSYPTTRLQEFFVSSNGQYVAYALTTYNEDNRNSARVFVWNRATRTSTEITAAALGIRPESVSGISNDGRYVQVIGEGDTRPGLQGNYVLDFVVRYDRQTNTALRINVKDPWIYPRSYIFDTSWLKAGMSADGDVHAFEERTTLGGVYTRVISADRAERSCR